MNKPPPLRDPEVCSKRHPKRSTLIINSRSYNGDPPYRRRRHRCKLCDERWTSYQSLMNPRHVIIRYKQVVPVATNHTEIN